MDLEHERRLSETEARSKANEKNIIELRGHIDAINRLATAVEVMATKQDSMSDSVDRLTHKVETLEAEPAKKWRFVVEKSIYFTVGAIMAYILSQIGL
jgi:hypothetical protein